MAWRDQAQLLYETLRAEALGQIPVQALDMELRRRWENLGFLGLFSREKLSTAPQESVSRPRLQGAEETAESLQRILEIYRSLIDKGLEGLFSRRVGDELVASARRHVRESVLTPATETIDDPEPSYAAALSD